jgi:hypothetical protein
MDAIGSITTTMSRGMAQAAVGAADGISGAGADLTQIASSSALS